MNELILKWALKNAIDHEGDAQVKAVVPKVIGENPELKKDIKNLMKEINEIVSEVNKMSLEEQIEKLKEIAPELLEKKKEKQELPEIPNAEEGKVVMMWPPEPSKYLHIGHAKAAILNHYYARKYKGKFYLRFEDTNPEKAKEEYYENAINDLKWLGIEWDKIDYVSDYIDKFYEYSEKLINEGKAYVCLCPVEKVRKLRHEGKECEHRNQSAKENLELWKKMLSEFKEGEASLRLKIDMDHKNAIMRDPTIMRIVETSHVRKPGYRVWPNYDFATAIMDGFEGITHRIRSKEFELRTELQEYIQKLFGIKSPTFIEIARFNLAGVVASGRIIREKVESGEYMGWDDPRLVTLISLRKRGFQPEAIRNFALNTGISKTESIIPWEILESENRKIIEPIADRYFFVKDKIKLIVRGIPKEFKSERLKHPNHPEHGKISYEINNSEETFYVDKHDFLNAKQGDILRLMDLMNIKIDVVGDEITAEFESKDYKPGVKVIHWVFEKENVPVKVLMADASTVEGVGEKAIENLKEGDIIQFIRFGYARLDKKDKTISFRYTHD
ncbi:MAG: glutamate--tRNA ligase [Nanoarchaeota archaeon]|nr:glutamate--tRNA ligase [Nanoarchaeota archaeon]